MEKIVVKCRQSVYKNKPVKESGLPLYSIVKGHKVIFDLPLRPTGSHFTHWVNALSFCSARQISFGFCCYYG